MCSCITATDHGTEGAASQVGAAMVSLRRHASDNRSRSDGSRIEPQAQCTSLKANMGHLEACAAAAGLMSLLGTPLVAGVVPTNAQLLRFAFHLWSFAGYHESALFGRYSTRRT